jgi:putative aldouronate transport system permease protein
VAVSPPFLNQFMLQLWEEAARLDGAGEIRIFFKIMVAVAAPLLATMAIFISVQHWNSWYESTFFVRDKTLMTLAYRMMVVFKRFDMRNLSASAAESVTSLRITPLSVQLAAMMIAVVPILAVYPFFQRYIISGITIGSVKG